MTQEIVLTLDNLADSLANDSRIKVAAVDIDGLLRGKIIHKEKFLQVAKSGFGNIYINALFNFICTKKYLILRFLFCYIWLGYSR